jgi:membrane-bound lytic murein transglycosylase D
MLRNRIALMASLALAAACSGGQQVATAPSPKSPRPQAPAPATTAQTPSTPPRAAEPVAIAPAPTVDSLLRAKHLRDIAEAVRLAADSVADEKVLEALADAHPADGVAEEEVPARWDIDVASWGEHERVRWYLDFFQGPGRERMQIWLDRMPRYEPMIREKLQAGDMPADLVYLALIESGFSNTATSRAKAVGMWQFMRPTGRHYGLRVDRWVDERRDPVQATDAAVRFLSDLYDRFGSYYLAAAAYNAGGGRINRSLRKMGITPVATASSEGALDPDAVVAGAEEDEEEDEETIGFSDADFFRLYDSRYIHRETKDYVPKLIAAALIAKEPRRWGFRPPLPVEPFPRDSIVVDGATGLDVIARLADTTLTAIRELNPQYLRLTTPPNTRSVVRLPDGRATSVAARWAEIPASERITFKLATARKGQTVAALADEYGVPATLIYDANPGLKGGKLRAGREIVIPTGGPASVAVAREVARSAPADDAPVGRRTHTVRKGETLSGIARRYGVSQAQLKRWNGLKSSQVRAGQRLKVGGSTSRTVVADASAAERRQHAKGGGSREAGAVKARTHKVRKGETLSAIAAKYGVTVDSIRQANGMSSSKVMAGKTLKIPARG